MIIPAIDLINGQVVRLYQGDYNQKTSYQTTVQKCQQDYAKSGAKAMHFVDLDGAKDNTKRQLSTLKTVVNHESMIIQVGGGIRCEDDVKQLLALGADPNKKTNFGHYSIHEATTRGHVNIVKALIQAGAKVNTRISPAGRKSPNQWTPLHYAAYNGNYDLAEILLSHGANIKATDLWRKTPLDMAVQQKHSTVVQLLKTHK